MTEDWKWKHGMISLMCIQVCLSGGMLRSVLQNLRLLILTLLQDGTPQVNIWFTDVSFISSLHITQSNTDVCEFWFIDYLWSEWALNFVLWNCLGAFLTAFSNSVSILKDLVIFVRFTVWSQGFAPRCSEIIQGSTRCWSLACSKLDIYC